MANMQILQQLACEPKRHVMPIWKKCIYNIQNMDGIKIKDMELQFTELPLKNLDFALSIVKALIFYHPS